MRVAEIIAGTIWLPGSDWSQFESDINKPPKISILLPTFCRAADGYFERAVRSVLDQSFRNIELIIVDDASIDGTRDLIDRFMLEDGRVSCLRHPRNIGLPAISEYEAYVKSRGEFIAFAFDDDEFLPNSLALLLEKAEILNADIIHGHVDIHATNILTDEPFVLQHFGMAPTPQTQLVSHNFFANNSVMLSRTLIENIGFYDPNIAVTRNCDWDLWLRISLHYRIHRVDVAMGKVSGPARKESLGRTYGLESYLSHEWTQLDRNNRLKAANFTQVDVQEIPESLSITSKMALLELHQNFRNKFWYQPHEVHLCGRAAHVDSAVEGQFTEFPDGYVLVVVASFDATVILHFEHLRTKYRQRLRIVHAATFESVAFEEITGASAVVFVRLLYPHQKWIDCAKKLGVPQYYFLDDNFSELAKTPEYAEYLAPYHVVNLTKALSSFSGVLLSTAALVSYFTIHEIHSKLMLFPPIAKRPTLASLANELQNFRASQPFTVLFFGGSHRVDAFKRLVLPALGQLSKRTPLRLIVVGADVANLVRAYASITLVSKPVDHAYDLVLGELMHYRIDVLVHPGEENLNNAFKNLNVLINAHYLQAVPLLSKVEPYLDLCDGEFAYLASSEAEWLKQLCRIFNQANPADGMKAEDKNDALLGRLESFINARFDGHANEQVITTILDTSAYAGLLNRDQRSRLAIFQERCKTQELESQLVLARSLVAQADGAALQTSHAQSAVLQSPKRGASLAMRLASFGDKLEVLGFVRSARLLHQRFSTAAPYRVIPSLWCGVLAASGWLDRGRVAPPRLVPSRDLSTAAYREFAFPHASGILSAIEFPLEITVRGLGEVGFELVDASDVIAANETQALPILASQATVKFEFFGIDLAHRGKWRLRVFVRNTQGMVTVPIYRVGGALNADWTLLARYGFTQK